MEPSNGPTTSYSPSVGPSATSPVPTDIRFVRYVVSNIEGLDEDSERVLLKMDPFTAVLMKIAPSSIIQQNEHPWTDDRIKTEEANL